MEEGIDRQGMHTFWRNYVSKLKKRGGGIHASGACEKSYNTEQETFLMSI
jgi:hypothetical protein